MNETDLTFPIGKRFRSFLPVVIDVETGGFNAATDALLEVAVVTLRMDDSGFLHPDATWSTHVKPFEGANLEPKSLEITGIDPHHPLRAARDEKDALNYIFKPIHKAIKENLCTRAILVGHNAAFDLSFINAAVERAGIKRNPLHPFSTFDTVSFAALAVGQTVLAKACQAADLGWNDAYAHSAVYDTERTAELFCTVFNRWQAMEMTCGGKARKLAPRF